MAAQLKDAAWLEWMASLMGGASRQRHAATLPPDLYWCLLDELPLHLLPAGALPLAPPERKQEFVINPRARILPEGQVPAELAVHRRCLKV